ncbi:dipeptidyl aminopeptidase/acylaminoacyl peptidase [Luteibacter rhizovicinus]|uniref:Dipeptidyl aminopeptidase/acylaminoacyl peptidase n=1 Tax=Luteibacter rhizovicinus TaxID=242606 RepID=A0A4R3YPZ4_9GAMM|nr:prolyl oligopeptidase family serine peptidase [Luteibacter rhizovicinus]TCV94975.1 dipeptidyl aminopeptidase/acylaminoacyl peptidase [Luteibacter rhizovicinus]
MSRYRVRAVVAALCMFVPVVQSADLIPASDFARKPELLSPRLSPDGKHISIQVDDPDGRSHSLAIYDVDDMTHPVSLIRMPMYEVPAQVVWVNSTRIVVAKGKQYGSVEKPFMTGELLAVDVNGKRQDYLYGSETFGRRSATRSTDRGWGTVDGLPVKTNGHFYMRAVAWDNQNRTLLYDVDAETSARHLMTQFDMSDVDFMVGADGNVLFAWGKDNDFNYVVYHRENNSWAKWGRDQSGVSFSPIRQVSGGTRLWAFYSPAGGPAQLVEQDESGANRKVLAKDDFGSVSTSGLWTAAPEQPFGVRTLTGVPKVTYLDPQLPAAKIHAALSQKFPGYFVHFVDFSEDGGQLLVYISSDRDPGRYFMMDMHTLKAKALFASEPWVDPAKMAERRPIRFKASDGREIEGILTLPKGKTEAGLPMVLLPHGGPHGVSDDWFYDSDAQFLANRGYLVLQVNYRGSSGRGAEFDQAGYLKWGTRVQQDMIDGVKWAIDQTYADPKRICVYGASFGAYSAMMTVARAPGMFRCAIGYAGIYDLKMMYSKGDIRQQKYGRSYLTNVIGRDDADLAANSPTMLADKIDVPVFLVHGEDDQRAPFEQAKAMRAALDKAHRKYEWMSVPGEGHGFYKSENEEAFLTKMETFLKANIGEGDTPAATK